MPRRCSRYPMSSSDRPHRSRYGARRTWPPQRPPAPRCGAHGTSPVCLPSRARLGVPAWRASLKVTGHAPSVIRVITAVVGLVGVLGTLVGVLLTQWRADIRERNRLASEERREASRSAAEVERERDSRLFDHRRMVYLSVLEQYHRWSAIAEEVRNGTRQEPPEDAMNDFLRLASEVELYGNEDAANATRNLYFNLKDWIYGTGEHRVEPPETETHEWHYMFLDAARVDLGLPAFEHDPLVLRTGTKWPVFTFSDDQADEASRRD